MTRWFTNWFTNARPRAQAAVFIVLVGFVAVSWFGFMLPTQLVDAWERTMYGEWAGPLTFLGVTIASVLIGRMTYLMIPLVRALLREERRR